MTRQLSEPILRGMSRKLAELFCNSDNKREHFVGVLGPIRGKNGPYDVKKCIFSVAMNGRFDISEYIKFGSPTSIFRLSFDKRVIGHVSFCDAPDCDNSLFVIGFHLGDAIVTMIEEGWQNWKAPKPPYKLLCPTHAILNEEPNDP